MALSRYEADVLSATTLAIKNHILEKRNRSLVIPLAVITTDGTIEVDQEWQRRCSVVTDVDINSGYCFIWAYVMHLVLGSRVTLWSTQLTWHAFPKIDNRFYDSAHPNGVFDWRSLNREWKQPNWKELDAQPFSPADFIEYWHMTPVMLEDAQRMAQTIRFAINGTPLLTFPIELP